METKVFLSHDLEQGVSSPELYARFMCKIKAAFHGAQEARVGQDSWRKILLAMGIILVLTFMVMLLLWNYKCIVVDHLCGGADDSENPRTKDYERFYSMDTNDFGHQS